MTKENFFGLNNDDIAGCARIILRFIAGDYIKWDNKLIRVTVSIYLCI